MATRTFQLAIDAVYKGAPAFRKAEADLKGLERDGDKAASGVKRSWGGVAAGAGVAVAALGTVAAGAKFAWETLGEGAALELARSRFENLSESIDTTADSLLGKMREATSGMISDAQLMASGTDIMSLGLAKTEDQTVRLASVIGQLGWDMQQVVLTMANNSKMRLDALGLSVEDVNGRVAKLRESGMSLDEAFDLAVIEAGEAKLGMLGSAADSSAGKIQQLKAVWENATNAFKEEFAGAVVDQLSAVSDAITALGPGFEQGMAEVGRQAGTVFSDVLAEIAAGGVNQVNQQLADELDLDQMARRFMEIQAIRESGVGMFGGGRDDLIVAEQLNDELERMVAAARDYEDVRGNTGRIGGAWTGEVAAVTALGQSYEWLIGQYNQVAIAAEDAAGKEQKFQEWLKGRDREAEAVTGTGRAYEWLIGQYDAAAEAATAASEEQQKAADDAAAAAEEDARRVAEAWQAAAQQASNYFVDAMRGQQDYSIPDLVTPERDVSYTVSGPSQDQLNLMDEYQKRYDAAATEVYELSVGLGTAGLSQEQLNDRIATANTEMEHYAGLMAGMQLPATQTATAHQELAFNMDMVSDAMYNAGVSAGWSVTQIAGLGVATGQFTPEAADAAVKTQLFYSALDELAKQRKLGNLDTSEYMTAVQQLVTDLENNSVIDLQVKLAQVENPARELWAGLPAEERQPVEIPVEFTPEQTALNEAIDLLDGIPDNAEKTITFDAETDAVTGDNGAVSEIQTAISDIDSTIPFGADYQSVTPDATGDIQQAIYDIDGTVLMSPDAQAVYNTMNDIDGSRLTVYVDYVASGAPPAPPGDKSGPPSKRGIGPFDKYDLDYSGGATRSGGGSVYPDRRSAEVYTNYHGGSTVNVTVTNYVNGRQVGRDNLDDITEDSIKRAMAELGLGQR